MKHPFSLLVGVALSDMLREGQGNLCVWPGSHYFTNRHSRWPDGKIRRAGGGWSPGDGPLPDLGQASQLRLKAGDVVLLHCESAHCGGPLESSDIRYMVYFRIRHCDWERLLAEEAFAADMWCDLEGVQEHLREAEPTANATLETMPE
ncbi:unnamed protein product [Polarella glacialis]|uniref:Phytanoyl-CoA dioxygenase n=1 Tax=Polarella glacialis TaxID=89957 RepID=A0A813J992_POLGL|nr:unnamed protein product [Polarella glacialis]